jgi:hypothetical protein
MSFYEKYMKYKTKYIDLKITVHNKKLVGGNSFSADTDNGDFINSLGSTPTSIINTQTNDNQTGGNNVSEINYDLPDRLTDTPNNQLSEFVGGASNNLNNKIKKKKDTEKDSDFESEDSDLLSFSSDSIESGDDM